MNIGIEIKPLGNKLSIRFQGQLVCSGCGFLRKSHTFNQNDGVVKNIFGSKVLVKKFLKANRIERFVVDAEVFMLDTCDTIQ